MYHIGDVVVYGSEGVCEIKEITSVRFGKDTGEYYILSPLNKSSETFYVPTTSEKVLSRMRPVLSKDEAEALLTSTGDVTVPWIENERERAAAYKDVMLYGTSAEMMALTKTLYRHQIEQLEKGKKLHAADERLLKDAEKILFSEFAYALKIPLEEVLPRIMKANGDA